MSSAKRKTYTLQFKLDAVNYALNSSHSKAAEHFKVHRNQIQRWKNEKDLMEAKGNKEAKVVKRIRSIKWPELEVKLKEWVLKQRKEGYVVSGTSILSEARIMAVRMKIKDFKGSTFWISSFMKRNRLTVRAVSSVGQKLPDDWEQQMMNFVDFVSKNKEAYSLQHIGNMDEVPVTFDMPSKFTVDQKGSSDVRVATTGAEKSRFTVVLCVTADGYKLPAYVIFRRKTIPKRSFPQNVIVSANEKSCMTSSETLLWFEKVWLRRRMAIFNPKSLLMLDSAPGHRTAEVKSKFVANGTLMAMIPGGLTKKLQVLDISVNKSFKAHLRRHWENWMINGYKQYTKSGNLKRASCEEICQWISESWDSVPVSAIKNGFKKTTINFYPNEHEDVEDVVIEESDEESEESKDEVDEDQGIREQLIDILLDENNFGSEDEDYDD